MSFQAIMFIPPKMSLLVFHIIFYNPKHNSFTIFYTFPSVLRTMRVCPLTFQRERLGFAVAAASLSTCENVITSCRQASREPGPSETPPPAFAELGSLLPTQGFCGKLIPEAASGVSRPSLRLFPQPAAAWLLAHPEESSGKPGR